MAPEMFGASRRDTAVDVYSLRCLYMLNYLASAECGQVYLVG